MYDEIELRNYPRMQGSANMARGASYFDVPMVSYVKENLYQGCSPSEFEEGPYLIAEDGFTHVLDLYPWGEYPVKDGVTKLSVEMYDSGDEPDQDAVDSLADMVIGWMDEPDSKVLVHCQAGLNRSSLIIARVLMKRYGFDARDAISLIRFTRSPMCLCNQEFQDFLLAL